MQLQWGSLMHNWQSTVMLAILHPLYDSEAILLLWPDFLSKCPPPTTASNVLNSIESSGVIGKMLGLCPLQIGNLLPAKLMLTVVCNLPQLDLIQGFCKPNVATCPGCLVRLCRSFRA